MDVDVSFFFWGGGVKGLVGWGVLGHGGDELGGGREGF